MQFFCHNLCSFNYCTGSLADTWLDDSVVGDELFMGSYVVHRGDRMGDGVGNLIGRVWVLGVAWHIITSVIEEWESQYLDFWVITYLSCSCLDNRMALYSVLYTHINVYIYIVLSTLLFPDLFFCLFIDLLVPFIIIDSVSVTCKLQIFTSIGSGLVSFVFKNE